MGGQSGSSASSGPPGSFQPAFTSLFNSAFGAGRTAAGQAGTQGVTDQSRFPSGMGSFDFSQFGLDPAAFGMFAPPPSGGTQPFAGAEGAFPTPNFASAQSPQGFPTIFGDQILGNDDTGLSQQGFPTRHIPIPLAQGRPIIGAPFGGNFTAGTTPEELASLDLRTNVAAQNLGAGDVLGQMGQIQAGGGFLNANPFLNQAISASLAPAVDDFTRSTLPQFGAAANQSGAFGGSSARDFAFNNLANDFGRNLLNTAGQIGFSNFANERQLMQNAGQLINQGAQLNQLSPEILAQVGAGRRALEQRGLDEALLQFQEQQQAPFRPLGQLASIIQGTNIGTTQNFNPQQPSPLAGGIAGALGGGSLGMQAGSQFNPQAGMGGGLLGGLLGGLAGGLG